MVSTSFVFLAIAASAVMADGFEKRSGPEKPPTPASSSASSSAPSLAPSAAPSQSASPPIVFGQGFIPAPVSNGGIAWKAARDRAVKVVSQMTLEERVTVITGTEGPCVGNSGAVPRLKIPSLCLQDGPAGVRPAFGQSMFAPELTVGATWDRDLSYASSKAMGQEFRDLGVNIPLAPTTGGGIGRSPLAGRGWENFSPDPYLTGELSYQAVKGLQSNGIMGVSKHYVGNEQETDRGQFFQNPPRTFFNRTEQLPISSNFDDKTNHELYTWPFAEAIRAGTAYIMCSYNGVNGTAACKNDFLLNGILKTELNFQGAVCSDWGAVDDTIPYSKAGLDIVMPGQVDSGIAGPFFGANLVAAVKSGAISEARVTDQVVRFLTPYYASGQAEKPLPSVPFFAGTIAGDDTYRNVQKSSSVALIRKIGAEGTVLLKNTNNALPLKKPEFIAVLGADASTGINALSACQDGFGYGCPSSQDLGTVANGLGSGYSFPHNLIPPLAAIQFKALEYGGAVQYSLNNTEYGRAQFLARKADTTIVFAGRLLAEGIDNRSLRLDKNATELINSVTQVSSNVIVVIHTGGAVDLEPFIENPNVTAVVMPFYPGEQSGLSLTDVLFGAVSPGGKLPFTIGKSLNDYIPNSIARRPNPLLPVFQPEANFTEGVNIDYRWFDANKIQPRYEFGFGLSYTTFSYSSIKINYGYKKDDLAVQVTKEPFESYRGCDSLYDTIATVSVDIKNTGKVTGSEAAQLYVQFPPSAQEPPRILRGFSKVKDLKAGAKQTVSFPLRLKDLSIWDVKSQKWVIPAGEIIILVGSSSRNTPLSIAFNKNQK